MSIIFFVASKSNVVFLIDFSPSMEGPPHRGEGVATEGLPSPSGEEAHQEGENRGARTLYQPHRMRARVLRLLALRI